MSQVFKDQHVDVGGLTVKENGKIVFGNDLVTLVHSTGQLALTVPILKQSYDSAAYFTITQADGGGVTLASTSDGTAGFTFSQAVTLNGTAKQQGENLVINQYHRVTAAEVNAGHTLMAAVTGLKYRLIDVTLIAIGGNAGTATTVDILATQGTSGVKLVAAAIAALTQSAVVKPNTANVSVLANGASFVKNDAATAITIGKTGGNLDTATHIDVILTCALEA